MGILLFQGALFVLGCAAIVFGKIPVTWRRKIQGSPAYVVGALLMAPLPLYLMACRRSNVDPFGAERRLLDPIERVAEGYVRLFGLGTALTSLLIAIVLSVLISEPPRRP